MLWGPKSGRFLVCFFHLGPAASSEPYRLNKAVPHWWDTESDGSSYRNFMHVDNMTLIALWSPNLSTNHKAAFQRFYRSKSNMFNVTRFYRARKSRVKMTRFLGHSHTSDFCRVIRSYDKIARQKSPVYGRLFLQRVCTSYSVCLSVCLSVCQSHSGIVYRRMKIRSCGFQHLVGQSL